MDPRDTAAPIIKDTYDKYPHLGPVLPAVGYYPEQIEALEQTINDSGADVVVGYLSHEKQANEVVEEIHRCAQVLGAQP